MDKDTNGSLVIIGNGFDLNCGLESSFRHFIKKIDTQSNIWYLMFSYAFSESDKQYSLPIFERIKKGDILWMDVEDYIKRILYMHRNQKNEASRLYQTFGCRDYLTVINNCYQQRFNTTYLYNNIQFCSLKDFFGRRFEQTYENFDVVAFLSNELIRFEEAFKKYILSISNDEKYKKNSATILGALIDDEETYDILTFNYTKPDYDAVNLFSYNNINHIHGSVDSKIIIGFDSNDIQTFNDNRIKMSKPFQKLFYKTKNKPLPEKEQTMFLKFYGHSLGNQDYSYFHSIFDYYDIYNNGKIALIFYYTPYFESEKENERYRNDYINKVYDLLNAYSLKAAIGTDKNNVILSRLMLENRLFIKEIKKLS